MLNNVKHLAECTGKVPARDPSFLRMTKGSQDDKGKIDEAIQDAISAAVLMMQGQVDKAMNNYNAKKQG